MTKEVFMNGNTKDEQSKMDQEIKAKRKKRIGYGLLGGALVLIAGGVATFVLRDKISSDIEDQDEEEDQETSEEE